MRVCILLILTIAVISTAVLPLRAETNPALPPVEVCIFEPVLIENISIIVPAVKSGPFINRSCRIKENLAFSSSLPASVQHEKKQDCPEAVARILAEMMSSYHSQTLPLTIFNGWQWEYTYSMCQFESVNYNLKNRGGCWEDCWEAALNASYGVSTLQWLEVTPSEIKPIKTESPLESDLKVKTFSSMRTRDGYPKERQL